MLINKVYLTLGYACNMNCAYCTQSLYDKSESKDWEINYNALDKICKIPNHFAVTFFGGEPLVYLDKVFTIVDYMKSKTDKVGFGLITNGKALTVDLAKRFNDLEIGVTVSHDGLKQMEYRGFDPLIDNREAWLTLNNRNLSAVISATNPSFQDVWKYVDEFEKKYSDRREQVHFEFIKDIHGNVEPQFLLYENKEFETSLNQLFNKLKEDIENGNFTSREFQFALPYLRGFLFRMKQSKPVPACGVNLTACQTDIRGVLYTCHGTQDQIGTIEKDGVIAGADSPYIETLCKDCDILDFCGGGCILPRPESKKYECYMNKQFYGRFKKLLIILQHNPYVLNKLVSTTSTGNMIYANCN